MRARLLSKSRIVVPRRNTKTATGKRRAPHKTSTASSQQSSVPPGTEVSIRESSAEAQIIYGRFRVGGVITFTHTNNNSSAYFTSGSSNSTINWIAQTPGTGGNAITIQIILSGTHASIAVSVTGNAITVTLKSTSGTSLSTANDVIAAVRASSPANALVAVNNEGGDGTALAAAVTTTALNEGGGTWLYETITLAGHQIDAIEKIYLDNVAVTFGASPDPRWGTGVWAKNAFAGKRLGVPGQTVQPDFNSRFPTIWKTTATQSGCAASYEINIYNPNTYPNGEPTREYLVRGKLVFDPRNSATVWSQNAALCVADFLNDPIYGFGVPYSNIDTTCLVAAANVCDIPIALAAGGTEPQYQINGAFDSSQDKDSILEQMGAAMGGFIVEQGGNYYIYAGSWRGASALPALPCLTFGSSSGMDISGLVSMFVGTNKPFTIFAVVQNANTTGNQAIVTHSRSSDFNAQMEFMSVRASSIYEIIRIDDSGTQVPKDIGTPTTSKQFVRYVFDGVNGTIYVNGVSIGTRTQNIGSTTPDHASIGYMFKGGTDHFVGNMAEIILYTSALGSAQIQAIETYLNSSWVASPTDPSQASNVTQPVAPIGWYNAVTSPITADGSGNVSQWNDISGNNNHATASGTLRPTLGTWSAAVPIVLTQDDLSGQVSIQTHVQRSDSFNSVSGTFVDPVATGDSTAYQSTDFPSVSNATYVTQDGGRKIWEDVSMPFVVSATQCQRLAKQLIERVRRGTTITWPGKLSCLQLQCGDIIPVVLPQFGYSTQTWEVQEDDYVQESDGTLSTDLVLRLTDSGVYNWAAEETAFTQAASTTLPSPADVTAPASLTVASDIYQRTDGTSAPRAQLTWPLSTSIYVQLSGGYEIQFKLHSSGTWLPWDEVNGLTALEYVTDIQSGSAYDFQIRGFTIEGYTSAWVQSLNQTISGDTVPPANVTGFAGVVTDQGIKLTWNPVADLDAAYYEIRLGSTWSTATKIVALAGSGTSYLYQQLTAGSYVLKIKAIDRTGNYSTTEATQTITISNPNAVTNLAVVTVNNNLQLSWTNPAVTSLSVNEYDIYKGATFAEAVKIGTVFGNLHSFQERAGGEFSYWIVSVDIGGNRAISANISTTVTIPPDYFVFDDRGLTNAAVTSSNYVVMGGSTLAPADDPNSLWAAIGPGTNATELFTDWFTNNGWTTLQDAITAGFDAWLEPGVTSPAFIEFTVNYGSVFASSFIDFLYIPINLGDGNVTVTPTIKTSPNGVTYTTYAGASQVFANNFQYVIYRLDIVATDNKAIITVEGLEAILSLQNSDEYGNFTANASDVGGTLVTLQNSYVKLSHIQVTASNPAATISQNNFNFSTIDPTTFPVLLFDNTGARVTSVCSYHVTGALLGT